MNSFAAVALCERTFRSVKWTAGKINFCNWDIKPSERDKDE